MYSVYLAHNFSDLRRFIDEVINPNHHKIISVTEGGNTYTVVYQIGGR